MTNSSGNTLSPHFASSTGSTTSAYWQVLSGPAELSPGESATYVLLAPEGGVGAPGISDRILLRAVTPVPMTMSTQLIGFGPSQTTVTALQQAEAAAQAKAQADAAARAKAQRHKHGQSKPHTGTALAALR